MTTTVAILNQKGGVGKTTVTLGLASAAQAAGARVLVVDLDPQASATWSLGVDPAEVTHGVAEVLETNRTGGAARAIHLSSWGEEVAVLPATLALGDREAESGTRGIEARLRRTLEGATDEYEFVFIDCAPALGVNTVTALAAADLALLVVEPAALSLRGVAAVTDLIDEVWSSHNDQLDIAGVVVNRVPAVSSEADRQYEELARIVGKRAIWQPPIPQRVVVAHALAERRPVHDFGARAASVTEIFDRHLARLRRTARRQG